MQAAALGQKSYAPLLSVVFLSNLTPPCARLCGSIFYSLWSLFQPLSVAVHHRGLRFVQVNRRALSREAPNGWEVVGMPLSRRLPKRKHVNGKRYARSKLTYTFTHGVEDVHHLGVRIHNLSPTVQWGLNLDVVLSNPPSSFPFQIGTLSAELIVKSFYKN